MSEKSLNPLAPSFMRPQRPVLDEPLDIERGQKTIPPPFSESRAPQPQPIAAASQPTVADYDVDVEKAASDAVTPSVTSVKDSPAINESPAAVPPVPVEPDPEVAPSVRQRLTPLQRLIVTLLVIVIALLAAIAYLTITGRIALRPEVLPALEAWLDGIL